MFGFYETDCEDDRAQIGWGEVNEVCISDVKVNPDRAAKTKDSGGEEDLPKTLRRGGVGQREPDGDAERNETSSKTRAIMRDHAQKAIRYRLDIGGAKPNEGDVLRDEDGRDPNDRNRRSGHDEASGVKEER